MKCVWNALFFVVALVTSSLAVHVAVLETGADGDARELVSASDRIYLTNVLREEAVKQLPAVQNYTIMTRENITAMLPPGKSIEDCEGSCLAETGKNISADYICQARVGSFGGSLTLSAELYETAGNKLIASFNGHGNNVNELLEIIKEKSPEFFTSVKGGSMDFVGGIGSVGAGSSFSYAGKKKYIVEILSNPSGAVPTIDGKAIPKCLSTPCKVQVDEGNHRFVASKNEYDDGEVVVEVTSNNQKVEIELVPNFGWLEMRPVLGGGLADKGKLTVTIDGKTAKGKKTKLLPGLHDVRVSHPCYDPLEFKVVIAKNQTETFSDVMTRGVGALELSAEYKEEPQVVAVYIDGVEVGSTPFAGEVPLCAEVTLKGNGWSENVDVTPKWHKVVPKIHVLSHAPEVVAVMDTSLRARADAAYDELDDEINPSVYSEKKKANKMKAARQDNVPGSSIPANVDEKKSGGVHWGPLSIGAVMAVTGTVLAIVENNAAKKAANKDYTTVEEYNKYHDDAKSAQTARGVGLGLAIVGTVVIGLSFAF